MYNGWVSDICAAAGRVCQSVLDLLQMGREPPRRALHTRGLGQGPRCGRLVLPIGQSDAVGTAGQAGGGSAVGSVARERLTCSLPHQSQVLLADAWSRNTRPGCLVDRDLTRSLTAVTVVTEVRWTFTARPLKASGIAAGG